MRSFLLLALLGIAYGAPTQQSGLCEVCHLLVGEVQDLFTTGQTQKTILNYVQNSCAKLPNEEKDTCHSFIRDNSGIILDKLSHDLSPHDFCMKLEDVCPKYEKPEVVEPEVEEPEVEESVTGNPIECELCKLIVLGIDKIIIGSNKSEAVVNKTLEKFCDDLPDKVSGICKIIEPLLLKAITSGLEPEVACKFATLCLADVEEGSSQITCDTCHSAMKAIGIEDTGLVCVADRTCKEEEIKVEPTQIIEPVVQAPLEQIQPQVKGALECQICKFAVQAVDKILGTNRSVAAVNDTLMKVCNSLPDELKNSCLNVEPDILKAILGGIDPTKACDFLKICNNAPNGFSEIPCDVCKNTLEAVAGETGLAICDKLENICAPVEDDYRAVAIEADAECELCKFVVQLLDNALANGATIEKVNATLIGICNSLPDTYKPICLGLVPQIDSIIASGVDPTTACTAINFCTANDKSLSLPDELKCEICDKLIEDLPVEEAAMFKSGMCTEVCHKRQRRSVVETIKHNIESPLLLAIEEKRSNNVGDLKCEICEALIDMLDKYITDNATDDKINATLLQLCSSLPSGEFQDICMQYEPQIMAAIEKGFDPPTTCQTAGLCAAKKDLTLSEVTTDDLLSQYLKQKNDKNVGDIKCDICEGVVELVDKYIENNATDEKINATLYQICSSLPDGAFRDICNDQVPAIMKIIESGGFDPQTVCTKAGLCNDNTFFVATEAADEQEEEVPMNDSEDPNLRDLKCTVCEEVIKEIDSLVAQNETIDKINATIYDVCSKLTGALQNLCLQAAPTILQAIEAGADPEATCKATGLCTSDQPFFVATEAEDEQEDEVPMTDSEEPNLRDLKCTVCEEVIKEIDSLVAQNETIEKINATIYDVCSKLTGALQDLCLQAAPTILQAIEAGADPEATCKAIGLCSSDQQLKPITPVEIDIECDICEFVISEMDKILADNATDAKINATIYSLCTKFSGVEQLLCRNLAPVIVDQVIKGLNPTAACKTLTLCPSAADVTVDDVEEVVVDESSNDETVDVKCDVCEFLIGEMDKILVDNATDRAINQSIYKVCGTLPATLQPICTNLAPGLVNIIEAGIDPTAGCQVLTLCPTNVDESKEVVIEKSSNDETVDVKCDICEFLIGEMDKILVDNATDRAINQSIYKVCGTLPATFQPICTNLAPGLVNIIEAGINPTAGCQVLTLCPTNAVQYDAPADVEEEDVAVEALDCELCRRSLQSAYNEIDEIKVESVLLKICSNMPFGLKEQCENLINENGGRYLKMVLEQYTPTSLCEIAHCYENGEPGFNRSS